MKTKLLFLVSILFALYTSAQSNSYFDEVKLLERLKILSSDTFEGRRTGEKGNLLARDFIMEQFKSLGAQSFGSKYDHHFSFKTGNKTYKAANILSVFKGTVHPKKYIVISAHYDHLGIRNGKIYNGADDDASGIAALFSFAEYLSKNPPNHSIVLAAFDGEELGLQGARYFVDKMKNSTIIANINMDMISRSKKDELYVVGTRYNTKLTAILADFKNPTSSKLLRGHDGTDGKQDWTSSSDHGAFHAAKIPFLYFGNEDHSGYHHPSDDFKDITPQFYKNAVKIIMALFIKIDTSGL